MRNYDHIMMDLEYMIGAGNKAAEAIVNRVKKSPLDALKWSGNDFEIAIRGEVAEAAHKFLTEHGKSLPELRAIANDRAMTYARYNHFSTSPGSNQAAAFEAMAWAKIAETVGE